MPLPAYSATSCSTAVGSFKKLDSKRFRDVQPQVYYIDKPLKMEK
jgi:hypothetical protein